MTGCVNLSIIYDIGEGVKQDYFKALDLYGKACDMKYEIGCSSYARLKNKMDK